MGKARQHANFKSGTNLHVDVDNGRVGVGTTIPSNTLQVLGTIECVDINSTGILTATSAVIDNEIVVGTGVTIYGNSGIISATSFNFTGNLYQNGNEFIPTYASTAGIATYASTAGISTYATTAGIATYATTAGISTVSEGLTGTPNISVGIVTASSLLVTGQSTINNIAISTVGVNTTLEAGKTYVYYSGVTSLTLPSSPTYGDTLRIINRSNTTTAQILRNGSNIVGFSSDLEFDVLDAGYTFTYADDYDGWIFE